MLDTILGTKKDMAQIFESGRRVPVTRLQIGPCIVVHSKTQDRDGYWALQLGIGTRRIKNITKPIKGHLKGAAGEKQAPRFLREVRLTDEQANDLKLKPGDEIKVDQILKVGDLVMVEGVSKGKGFAGVVKRWGFAGGPKTHGQSDRLRAPGSIGAGTDPGRVLKGKKMAGRMGQDKRQVHSLKVLSVDSEMGLVEVSGPIPGPRGSLVRVVKQEPVRSKDE